MTKSVESMQSSLRQALKDKSFKNESYAIDLGASPAGTEQISFEGGSVGDTAVDIDLTTNTAAVATTSSTGTGLTGASTLDAAGLGLADTNTFTIDDGTNTYTYTVADASTETLQDLVDDINADTDLAVTASISADGAFTLTADNNEAEIDVGGSGTIAGIADRISAKDWFPSEKIVIRDNLVEDIGGDGIVPRGTDGALIASRTARAL